MNENGRTNPVHLGERFNPYETRLDRVGSDPKGKHGYPVDRSDVGPMEGVGGGCR